MIFCAESLLSDAEAGFHEALRRVFERRIFKMLETAPIKYNEQSQIYLECAFSSEVNDAEFYKQIPTTSDYARYQ